MMLRFFCLTILIVLTSCGAYKELKPVPPVAAQEAGYTLLSNKDKQFELKKGKKYFMQFPAIQANDYYLVLRMNDAHELDAHLTRQFTKGKGDVVIPAETGTDPNMTAFTLDQTVSTFYWVIENVNRNLILNLEYRYMPSWRFRYESRSAQFRAAVTANSMDRSNYQSLGIDLSAEDLSYEMQIAEIDRKSAALQELQSGLGEIEALFPAGVRGSDDASYLDFLGLRGDVTKELAFQEQYRLALTVFKAANKRRTDTAEFVKAIPDAARFFEQKGNYPQNILQEARRMVCQRLSELASFYDEQIRKKRDTQAFNLPTAEAKQLFKECDLSRDTAFEQSSDFIEEFDSAVAALASTQERLDEVEGRTQSKDTWPANSYYPQLQQAARALQSSLLGFNKLSYGKYSSTRAAEMLKRQLRSQADAVNLSVQKYQRAAELVPQINRLRSQSDYRGIIQILKNNEDLSFLVSQYPDVDELSLKQQREEINRALSSGNFAGAERQLKSMWEDNYFIHYSSSVARKNRMVQDLESELGNAVESASRERLSKFVEANKNRVDNVEALYSDPAFQPVYELSFSSGGPLDLNSRKKRIQGIIDDVKFDRFPKMSIESLYKDFVRDIRDNGVAKARAIVAHGKYYQGNDSKIKGLVAECDPMAAKLITQPKDYRKIFVLPVNPAQAESNDYVFRVNLQIPSDAKFPVYDVNIKLPREVASSAGQSRWYDSITFNGKVLKNEGRFSIVAPSKDNEYQCQITPLQVNKNGDNILEVHFPHSAFKVLEVSIMAQRPIIKKN